MSATELLDDWFSRRTFSTRDFDLEQLTEAKRARGSTVSVVLPAQNEADTVGGMVEAAVSLRDGLVDEVVVLDGGSTDDTAGIAAAAGAAVFEDSRILPQFGPARGKGDALWRALHVTSGDIVAYVDTDIRNPDPRFIWGTVGPLLLDGTIHFTKGFYDRPLHVGDRLQPTGGGRVTELMARPLLNLFWPELAGMVQPLSGEYAGRRSVLEQVPFFTGYGVEIGLLIDILAIAGADAIAQCDVDERIHRNHGLPALSRMAFAIAHAALQRLADTERVRLAETLGATYVQFDRGPHGRMELLSRTVHEVERPPMRDVHGGTMAGDVRADHPAT